MRKLLLIMFAMVLVVTSCKLDESEDGDTGTDTGTGTTTTTMKITSPNGGESFSEGSSAEIKWTSNATTLLRIQFSYDNGASWYLVADSLFNSGVYSWFPLPTTISNQCKLRIATISGTAADETDQNFSITKSNSQSITLLSPVGGESWEAGSNQQIKWFSIGVDSLIIQYTPNNGITWSNVGKVVKNTGIFFWEPVPNTPSTLAKIRLLDADDSSPVVESPKVFEILPEPKIKVKAPNGGEVLVSGSDKMIEWESENIENVKIAYTLNNGYEWIPIIDKYPSTGFYEWKSIPVANSKLCKVRVYDAKDSEPWDVSDNVFSITSQTTQAITLTSPDGGESWEGGSSHAITWNSSGIKKVKIEYTLNNGLTWNQLVNNFENNGSYQWSIPDIFSSQCKIKVSDSEDGDPLDESNGVFTISQVPTLDLISPDGNENLIAGEPIDIIWTSKGIDNIKIEFTEKNGITESDWFTLVESTPAGIGKYSTSFTRASDLYRVRISDAKDGSPRDVSSSTFRVTQKPTIVVISPNGGENWLVGSPYDITWQANNIEKIRIEISVNGGKNYVNIDSNLVNNGYYRWTVDPAKVSFNSDLCKIRISEYIASDPTSKRAVDETDTYFSIHKKEVEKLIRVTAPNGGENFGYNEYNEIIWTSVNVDFVKIEYTINNGQNWVTIIDKYPSTGRYDWNPVDLASSLARVRITDYYDPTIRDESDNYFNLTKKLPSVKILSPVQLQQLNVNTQTDITFICTEDIVKVGIYSSIDNGVTWSLVTELNTPADIQHTFKWIPTQQTDMGRIRIDGYLGIDPNIVGASDTSDRFIVK